MQKSAAVPFLDEPANKDLKSMPGNSFQQIQHSYLLTVVQHNYYQTVHALIRIFKGYVGFDPLGFATLAPSKYLQEAEIKHGRAAMLAAAGAIAQDLYHFPGVDSVIGDAKLTGVHDKLLELNNSGNKQAAAMTQLLFWIGFVEVCTFPAIYETIQGSSRQPGDFMFDPLGFGKSNMADMKLKEVKNGRLAMIGIGGMVHHYLLSGKGPIAFITAPPFKDCIEPHVANSLCY
jgi:light-harvesting complex I chlorophyll a/b binding protein 4